MAVQTIHWNVIFLGTDYREDLNFASDCWPALQKARFQLEKTDCPSPSAALALESIRRDISQPRP